MREFLEECFRATEPWKASPRRMLRHRAAIQAIRIAFGLAGIMDEEEYRRMVELDERAARTAPAGSHGTPRTAADAAGQLAARAEARRTGATGNAQGSPAQAATEPEDVEFVAHDDPAEELAPSEPLAPDPAGDFPPYPSDAIDTTTRD